MARYFADIEDLEFNLFEDLKIQQYNKFGLEANDMKGIIQEYNKFVENEVFPSREPSDAEGVKLVDGKVIGPQSLKKFHSAFYENGWFGLGLSEEIGGTPVPEALQIACLSLITGANTAYSMYPGLSKAALNVIYLKGTDEMKARFLPPMMEGRWGGTMCLTEAGAGSDVGALRTTATPNGDGTYNISGVKIFISSGEVDFNENTIHLVLARTPGGSEGTKGISLFVVPRNWVNDDGSMGDFNNVRCTKVEEKMGIHASATCELTFGGEGPSRGYLIGEEFDGMATMFIMMNEARLLCALQGDAQANLAYLMALNYAKERVQFSTEIINHPDVRRMLAKMRAASRGMRALTLYTADLFNKCESDEELKNLISLLTPICKAYCSEEGVNVSTDAVQVHGGYGFCTEYGVEQFVRDTIIAKIYEGTNGIQAIDFVMRKILKDEGKTITALLQEIGSFVGKLDGKYQVQQAAMTEALKDFQTVLGAVQKWAVGKDMNSILQYAHDTLMMASHIVVSWRLGSQAVLVESSGASETYTKTKQEDFAIYCKYYLSKNAGLKKAITEHALNFSELVL
ncbi:MAG: acyl-CoA dehydrogenase [Halobacteriovoraceae bacterium]|nr:acyl-CoA dehydrogenase [Halobacteriovoraceae bacterium]MCB9095813.1 acyl-CoA dehydrogenase [Halobacteriovoraceae bacterium]